ncbi:MAG: hypothetical protein J5580_03100 [Clostridia bacterium]|nr:hypothetical protein [Clostridia bacterium]
MATAVESPGIVSAKEEAAAILFAREPQTTPIMTAPAPEQVVQKHEPVRPSFAHYHEPAAMPARPKVVDTTALRPYETYEEVTTEAEPQVVRPYIDSSEYLTSPVAPTTVAVQTPVTTVAEAPQTVTVVESPLDHELEEGTQYVVKFKKSTLAAIGVVASIFVLMTVLLIVNIVSLVTMSAEVNALVQESTTLEKSLANGQASLEEARAVNHANGGTGTQQVQYVMKAPSTYTEPTVAQVDSSFFDWLCHSLSRLFN